MENNNIKYDISKGMQLLNELVLENLTCEKEQKSLIACWLISAFVPDASPCIAIMQFSGATASGKTTAAKLLSHLICGQNDAGVPSVAAAYAKACHDPLVVIDNLEPVDISTNMHTFLCLTATRGCKEKRKPGTESETIKIRPKALVLVTSIEPFVKAELIARTYNVELLLKNKADSFDEYEAVGKIINDCFLILTSIGTFIQNEIIPNLDQRKEYLSTLKKEYPNHSKNRMDEYLATLMLILDKILKYIPFDGKMEDIWKGWIHYQNAMETDT